MVFSKDNFYVTRNGEENIIWGADSEILLEGSWLDWLPLATM